MSSKQEELNKFGRLQARNKLVEAGFGHLFRGGENEISKGHNHISDVISHEILSLMPEDLKGSLSTFELFADWGDGEGYSEIYYTESEGRFVYRAFYNKFNLDAYFSYGKNGDIYGHFVNGQDFMISPDSRRVRVGSRGNGEWQHNLFASLSEDVGEVVVPMERFGEHCLASLEKVIFWKIDPKADLVHIEAMIDLETPLVEIILPAQVFKE